MKNFPTTFIFIFFVVQNISAQYFNGNYSSSGGRLSSGLSNTSFNSYAAVGLSGEFTRLNAAGTATANIRYLTSAIRPYDFRFNDIKQAPVTTETYGIFGEMTHRFSLIKSPLFIKVSAAGIISVQNAYSVSGYSGINFTAVDVTPATTSAAGEFYAAGTAVPTTPDSSASASLVYFTRMNAAGVPVYSTITRLFKSSVTLNTEVNDILVDGNNVYVVGTAFSSTGPTCSFIVQFNRLTGNVVKRHRLNFSATTGINVYTINTIKKAADGNFYLTGYAKPTGSLTTTPRPLLVKVNLSSTATFPPILWAKTYTVTPAPASSFYESSDVDEAGATIFLSVRPVSAPVVEGKILLRLNSSGTPISAMAYNAPGLSINGGAINCIDANLAKNEIVMFGYNTLSSCCSPTIDKTYIGKARLTGSIPNTPNCPNAAYSATSKSISLNFVELGHSSIFVNPSIVPISLSMSSLSGGPCSTAASRIEGDTSDEESINDEQPDLSSGRLLVFPNPVNQSEKLNILLPYKVEGDFVQVFDYSGRQLNLEIMQTGNREYMLNTESLSSGMYFLVAGNGKDRFTEKFIVK